MRLDLQRLFMVILTIAMLLLVFANPAEAARRKKHAHRPMPDRSAEIVVEASSGFVLSEKNADKKLYPASLTKMMTLYLTFEAMEKGALSRNDYITVSKRAAAQEPSSLGLQQGDTIRVENAILAIATKSANDCAVALGEAIGESEERFARMMTMKARKLGMNNTRFVNASGLFKSTQVSTARDMAILAQALIRDYPRYYHYFSTTSFTYEGNTYFNHNKLMNSYEGMDGLKTGYVYASGYNLAASAVRNGTRLIGVVFGGRTAGNRNSSMAKLLNRGFASMNNVRIAALVKKGRHSPLPSRKPDIAPASGETVTALPDKEGALSRIPQLDPMGLAVEQGDAAITEDNGVAPVRTGREVRIVRGNPPPDNAPLRKLATELQPRTLNTAPLDNNWVIQIGAYASHEAGLKALNTAKTSLGSLVGGEDSIAPLMTNRGMIYRARLSGLARTSATQACEILKGSCLVLTVE